MNMLLALIIDILVFLFHAVAELYTAIDKALFMPEPMDFSSSKEFRGPPGFTTNENGINEYEPIYERNRRRAKRSRATALHRNDARQGANEDQKPKPKGATANERLQSSCKEVRKAACTRRTPAPLRPSNGRLPHATSRFTARFGVTSDTEDDAKDEVPSDASSKSETAPKTRRMNSEKAYIWFHTVRCNVFQHKRGDLFLKANTLPHEIAFILLLGWISLEECLEWADGRRTVAEGLQELVKQKKNGEEWLLRESERPASKEELSNYMDRWMNMKRRPGHYVPFRWMEDAHDRKTNGPFGPSFKIFASPTRLETIAAQLMDRSLDIEAERLPTVLDDCFRLLLQGFTKDGEQKTTDRQEMPESHDSSSALVVPEEAEEEVEETGQREGACEDSHSSAGELDEIEQMLSTDAPTGPEEAPIPTVPDTVFEQEVSNSESGTASQQTTEQPEKMPESNAEQLEVDAEVLAQQIEDMLQEAEEDEEDEEDNSRAPSVAEPKPLTSGEDQNGKQKNSEPQLETSNPEATQPENNAGSEYRLGDELRDEYGGINPFDIPLDSDSSLGSPVILPEPESISEPAPPPSDVLFAPSCQENTVHHSAMNSVQNPSELTSDWQQVQTQDDKIETSGEATIEEMAQRLDAEMDGSDDSDMEDCSTPAGQDVVMTAPESTEVPMSDGGMSEQETSCLELSRIPHATEQHEQNLEPKTKDSLAEQADVARNIEGTLKMIEEYEKTENSTNNQVSQSLNETVQGEDMLQVLETATADPGVDPILEEYIREECGGINPFDIPLDSDSDSSFDCPVPEPGTYPEPAPPPPDVIPFKSLRDSKIPPPNPVPVQEPPTGKVSALLSQLRRERLDYDKAANGSLANCAKSTGSNGNAAAAEVSMACETASLPVDTMGTNVPGQSTTHRQSETSGPTAVPDKMPVPQVVVSAAPSLPATREPKVQLGTGFPHLSAVPPPPKTPVFPPTAPSPFVPSWLTKPADKTNSSLTTDAQQAPNSIKAPPSQTSFSSSFGSLEALRASLSLDPVPTKPFPMKPFPKTKPGSFFKGKRRALWDEPSSSSKAPPTSSAVTGEKATFSFVLTSPVTNPMPNKAEGENALVWPSSAHPTSSKGKEKEIPTAKKSLSPFHVAADEGVAQLKGSVGDNKENMLPSTAPSSDGSYKAAARSGPSSSKETLDAKGEVDENDPGVQAVLDILLRNRTAS